MSESPFSYRFWVARIGWACGCWTGYPNRWWKRTRLVKWLARFDPMEKWPEPWEESYDA